MNLTESVEAIQRELGDALVNPDTLSGWALRYGEALLRVVRLCARVSDHPDPQMRIALAQLQTLVRPS